MRGLSLLLLVANLAVDRSRRTAVTAVTEGIMKLLALVCVLCLGCGSSAATIADEGSAEGTAGGPCYPNGTCNIGLTCVASRCAAGDGSAADTSAADDTTPSGGDSVAVDSASTDGVASDTASDGPKPPYGKTELAAACDTLGDGTLLAGVDGDDQSSAKVALPFAFKYFDTSVSQYSMASNGFAQLWTTASGGADKSPENVAIPTAGEPNGIVAPFWDDLAPMTSEARAATLGSAPNRRLVISWVHWTIKGDAAARLSFQVKLFETTNIIEFHYCAMAPEGNVRATGSSATIGLENMTGTIGVQHSFNTASSVASGKALRFAP